MSQRTRRIVITAELAAAAVVLGVFTMMAVTAFRPTEAASVRRFFEAPTMKDAELALYRVSITPETLAASGGSATDATTLLNAMYEALVANPGRIASRDLDLFDATNELDRLTELVRSGQASSQEIQACQTAKQNVANARAARDAALDDLFTEMTALIPNSTATTLATIRGNAAWDQPVEFKVVTREGGSWIRLREALANERISSSQGQSPDSADQAVLQSERSNATVSLAVTNLENNLAAVEQAWNNAVAGR